jgi:uncharacterized membrane protein
MARGLTGKHITGNGSPTMPLSYNRIASQGPERVAALTDGVFAFAMTVLVLDIRVPLPDAIHSEHDLRLALFGLAPRLVMYLMSFLTLGIFWVGQQTQMSYLAQSDRNFAWIQVGFMASVVLVPFSTGLLAEFMGFRTALAVYWLNIVLLGGVLYASWRYARHAGLLKPEATPDIVCAIERRIVIAQSFYALGALLAVVSTYAAIAAIVLIQLNYAVAPRFRLRKRHA